MQTKKNKTTESSGKKCETSHEKNAENCINIQNLCKKVLLYIDTNHQNCYNAHTFG